MTYKHAVGTAMCIARKCTVYFDGQFRPADVMTFKQAECAVERGLPMLVVEHGTVPGNSGSRLKAYAVMVPDGSIGYVFESDLMRIPE